MFIQENSSNKVHVYVIGNVILNVCFYYFIPLRLKILCYKVISHITDETSISVI